MQRKSLTFLLLCMFSIEMWAQVYAGNQTQHRFAQTYLGLNSQFVPASGELVWQNQTYKFPSTMTPRVTLGGLHFWGKLDFQMSFLLARFGNFDIGQDGEVILDSGGELSARYYPWRLSYGKVRPFLGVSFNSMRLSLGNLVEEKRYDLFITTSMLTGFSYAKNGWQISTEFMFLPQNERSFYSDRAQRHNFELPNSYFSLGLIKYFDTTLREEQAKISGRTKELEKKLLADGKLNSLSLGLAPSAAYFLKSPRFSQEFQSLPRHKASFNWDIGLGYLHHKAKLHVGVSYRSYASNVVSYGLEHVVRRQSVALEVIKFVWNYNGFVPFFGPSLSAERWATGAFINDVQQGATERSRILSPGIIFGWDIVPSPLETWVLRTNLRYYPAQQINDVNGTSSRVDQLEFNFIQFIFYPNRWKQIRNAKRNF